MEYGHWVEEQNRQISELRTVLQGQVSDVELRLLVDNAMKHYFQLFRMKSAAAKIDVFYIMSGMWKTSAERFFMWIGGFRPSELLKVIDKLVFHPWLVLRFCRLYQFSNCILKKITNFGAVGQCFISLCSRLVLVSSIEVMTFLTIYIFILLWLGSVTTF